MRRYGRYVLLAVVLAAVICYVFPKGQERKPTDSDNGRPVDQTPVATVPSDRVPAGQIPLVTMPTDDRTATKISVLPVPYLSQEERYPTGCESVSAVMLLQYWEVPMTVDAFIDGCLDCGVLRQTGDTLTGPNPNDRFVGNPREVASYGCYAPVIERALARCSLPAELRIRNLTGTDCSSLTAYIDRGEPMLVWATTDMMASVPGTIWIDESTGEPFQWIAKEHCLVLVGYDDDYYYCNDPYKSRGRVGYPRGLFEQRFEELGRQALVLTRDGDGE